MEAPPPLNTGSKPGSKDTENSALTENVKRMSLKELETLESDFNFASKIKPGTEGRLTKIRTNLFEVSRVQATDIFHYDINISPVVPPRVHRSIFQAMERLYSKTEFGGIFLAYDGRANVYASRALPKNAYVFDIVLTDEDRDSSRGPPSGPPKPGSKGGKPFTVKLKKVATISLQSLQLFLEGKLNYTPYEVLQALEVVFRHATFSATNMVNVGRNFYSSKNTCELPGFIDVWLGFFQSIRPTNGRLLLNVDTSASCFYANGSVCAFASETLNGRGGKPRPLMYMNDQERSMVERAIRGLKIQINHRGDSRKKYRVVGLSKQGSDKLTFSLQENETITVAEYFEKQYKLRLKYPSLPCVRTSAGKREIFLPMECCDIVPGQRYMKKLNEEQTAAMIKITCQKPDTKLNKIIQGSKDLQFYNNPMLKEFKMDIKSDVVAADCRILKAPTIYYGANVNVLPENGAWNLRDKKVFKGITIKTWGILNLSPIPPDAVNRFKADFIGICAKTGVFLEKNSFNESSLSRSPQLHEIERHLKEAYFKFGGGAKDSYAQFVLVIMPRKETSIYAEIKRVTDCLIGKISQCITAANATKGPPGGAQIYANIAIKLNVKLGGINSTLYNKVGAPQLDLITKMPTIVFGADVTHPAPGEGSKRSIAAVVASMDIHMSRYSSIVKIQESRQEIITDMKDIVRSHLISFHKATNLKPSRILFYRDGLSEGQFSHAVNTEVSAIFKACSELEVGYRPKLTFVVVQKRHHIRLFPTNMKDADRSQNLVPGSVVDTGITHPIYRDFFLMSHSGIQGTSRPSHYHVVIDENNLSSDEIQQTTYRLCYTYARCTRSVSIVPPAYYAHLVAYRARHHMKFDDTMSVSSSDSGGSDFTSPLYTPVNKDLSQQMYFC